jgi:hypothetical protein
MQQSINVGNQLVLAWDGSQHGSMQPPQRKSRIPQYAHKLDELQSKFDELEALGVFRRPEEVGVVAEYLNPSFLVKKASGGLRRCQSVL